MTTFLDRYGPWAVIAGATQGIGEQFSLQLAARGMNVMLIARGKEGLASVSQQLQQNYKVEVDTLAVDLAAEDIDQKLRQFVGDREVGLLVYNAIYSHIGEFLQDDLDSKMLSLNVNCRGPLVFVNQLARPMVKRQRGGIILMSSMSGFQGSALVSNYAATKAFNTVLAESLWEEFQHANVDVLGVVAGATRTPNFNRQTPADKAGSAFPMEPADVVREALKGLEKGKGPTLIVGHINRLVNFVMQRLFTRRRAVLFISKATRKLYETS